MRYFALASDYDGTLATDGKVARSTLEALDRLRASGRKLLLVTGRELDDLGKTFEHLDYFDRIVAENGALVYNPASHEEKILCEGAPEEFVDLLRSRGVKQISRGRVIVATWEPHQAAVLEAIRALGLELHVVFNKGAVMVLPSGINKATGLKAAIAELGLSAHNVVGIGDAENDHAFLGLCECGVAVENALPGLKDHADLVTRGARGEGVEELIAMLMKNDLEALAPRLRRHEIPLGVNQDGSDLCIPPYGVSLLVAGTSGGGKSTFASGFLERLDEHGYQFCIIDPEGDYQNFEHAVVLGDPKSAPTVDAVMQLLGKPGENAVVNLVGVTLGDRPAFFDRLFPALLEMRARTGRPHWIVIDETHHLLPATWDPAAMTMRGKLNGLLLVTVHPDRVSKVVLSSVDAVVAIGDDPQGTITVFGETLGERAPKIPRVKLEQGEAIGWWLNPPSSPFRFRGIPPRTEQRRHRRKYADGELAPEYSFYFRGPQDKLNLRAQNLNLFLQIADGVDDGTWMHHLRKGDYSRWFRRHIKDDGLADAAQEVERDTSLSAAESRKRIRAKIEERYTSTE